MTQFDLARKPINVREETKSENIFDIEFRLIWVNQRNKRLKQQLLNFKREEHSRGFVIIGYHGNLLPNKRLTYEKCFVLPLVDYLSTPKFQVLNVFMN